MHRQQVHHHRSAMRRLTVEMLSRGTTMAELGLSAADLGVASTFAASADSLDAAEMLPSSPRRNVAGSRSQPASPQLRARRQVAHLRIRS